MRVLQAEYALEQCVVCICPYSCPLSVREAREQSSPAFFTARIEDLVLSPADPESEQPLPLRLDENGERKVARGAGNVR